MRFIPSGPDVPERLLRAHEDGKVVFFCGAGISFPAGLPGFQGLVRRLYEEIGETQNDTEAAAFGHRQYDTAITLLEKRIAGGRSASTPSALWDTASTTRAPLHDGRARR